MHYSLIWLAATISLVFAAPTTNLPSGHYIIKLKPNASPAVITSSMNEYNEAQEARSETLSSIRHTYEKVMNGMSGYFTEDFLVTLGSRHRDAIDSIHPQVQMHVVGSQKNAPWGLTRLSERKLDLKKDYIYPDSAGTGVDVFIVDTGIWPGHTDFGGRATAAVSFVSGEDAIDGHGHGTHCAGTIGSKTYGIAKNVKLFGVKVLDSQGSGSDADVIAGVDYVAKNMRAGKTVLSMSLGGDKSDTLDQAVNAAVKAGVVVVVAAGNESQDACATSPAGASDVFTVGATDNKDSMAYFSNFGPCVKIFGPGVNVKSLWKGSDGATNTISGTSMATPHVAGVAALYLGMKSYSSAADVMKDMVASATMNAIKGLAANTVNALAFNTPGASNEVPPATPTDPEDPEDPEDPDWEPSNPTVVSQDRRGHA